MHPALMGALVGAGIGILMYVIDYMQLNSAANELAKRKGAKQGQLSPQDHKHMRAVGSFCLLLPVILALVFWMGSKIIG